MEIEDQKAKTRVLSEDLERVQLGLREQVMVCCKDVRYSNRASQLEKNITVNTNTPHLKPFLDMMIGEMKKDTADTVKNSRDSQQDNLFGLKMDAVSHAVAYFYA